MYEETLGVGANTHTDVPSPLSTGAGVGELEIIFQLLGPVTVNWKVAFRSGCSKTANILLESGTSNCV